MKTYKRSAVTDCNGDVYEEEVWAPKDVCYLHQRENGPFYKKYTCDGVNVKQTTYSDPQCTVLDTKLSENQVVSPLACLRKTSVSSYDRALSCSWKAPSILAFEYSGAESSQCIAGEHQKEQYWPYGMCLQSTFGSSLEWTCSYSKPPAQFVPYAQVRQSKFHSNLNCSGTTIYVNTKEPRFPADGSCRTLNKATETYRRRYYKYQSGCPERPSTTTVTTTTTTTVTTKGPCTLLTVVDLASSYTTCVSNAATQIEKTCACITSADSGMVGCENIAGVGTQLANLKSTLASGKALCGSTGTTGTTGTTGGSTEASASSGSGGSSSVKIFGGFTMAVAKPQRAIANTAFKTAIEKGIADIAGVPVSQVSAVLSVLTRRLSDTLESVARRLSGSIKVDYTVQSTVTQSANATASLTSVTKSNFAAAITTAIAASPNKATIEADVGTNVTVSAKTTSSLTTDTSAPTSSGTCKLGFAGFVIAGIVQMFK